MKKPNLFLVGAPKCGTTAVAAWLSDQDRVFMSPVKEPTFFNTDHLNPMRPTQAQYEILFENSVDAEIVGEASPWYLYSQDAVGNILQFNPGARFLVCVRDPVSMAYSMHNQAVFAGIEPFQDFRDAWAAQSRRERGLDVPARVERAHLLYGPICRVGFQLQRLLAQAEREKVHVIFLEDLARDPSPVLAGVLQFLSLPVRHPLILPVSNPAQRRRWPLLRKLSRGLGAVKRALGIRTSLGLLGRLDRWNRKPEAYRVHPELERELRSYFSEDVALLGRLTGRDLSHWLRPD